MATKSLDIEGPAGRLEAVLVTPSGPPRAAAVLCHAHPLHGGTMHFKLLYRVARRFRERGYAVLRFQFRGVGRSSGAFDEGRGEKDDARAAIDAVARDFPGKAIVLGGFSFGAAIALRVGMEDDRVEAVAALGLPVGVYRTDVLNPSGKPVLFVQAQRDEFGDEAAIRAFVRGFPGPTELVVVPESDHLFTGKIEDVEDAVFRWLGGRPGAGALL